MRVFGKMICFGMYKCAKNYPGWCNKVRWNCVRNLQKIVLPVGCSASVLSSGTRVHFRNGQSELVVIGRHHDIARVLGQKLARMCPLHFDDWRVTQNCAFDFLEIMEFTMNPVNHRHRLFRFRIIFVEDVP